MGCCCRKLGGVHPPWNLSKPTPIATGAWSTTVGSGAPQNPGPAAQARHRPGNRDLGAHGRGWMVGITHKPGNPMVFLGPRPWRGDIHEGRDPAGGGAGLERQRDRARALGLAIEAQRRISLEVCEADNGPRVPLQTFSPGGCSTSSHYGKKKLAFGLLNGRHSINLALLPVPKLWPISTVAVDMAHYRTAIF